MAEKRKEEQEEDDKCTHPLMCAEEWKDSEGAKVLAEYHKDGGVEEEKRVEEDLDAFERYWQKKQGINFQGEYHKEGAPFLEEPSGWDGHGPRGQHEPEAPRPTAPGEMREDFSAKEQPPVSTIEDQERKSGIPVPLPAEKLDKEKKEPLKITEVVDINTLEVVSYWIFRLAFGKQLHIPVKKEGLADLDVHINNKDVVVNTNQLYFSFPELVVWHITYTHKGRPVLEIGRGVKKGLKVHRINAFRLLMEVWMGSKRAEKESKLAALKAEAPSPVAKGQRAKDNQDLKEKGDIT